MCLLSGHHGIGKDFHAFPGLQSSGDDLTDEMKRANIISRRDFLKGICNINWLPGGKFEAINTFVAQLNRVREFDSSNALGPVVAASWSDVCK